MAKHRCKVECGLDYVGFFSMRRRECHKNCVGLYVYKAAVYALTNYCNITCPIMILFLQILDDFQSLGPFLDIGIGTIELIDLLLTVQDEHIIMIQ